jgi:hypothetical protein
MMKFEGPMTNPISTGRHTMSGGLSKQYSGRHSALTAIKLAHTLIWAFFAACILLLPAAALLGRFDWALLLTALILVECSALALNRGRCPLTTLAAQFTSERQDGFDIYLPGWLAHWNKVIFGTLFVLNELLVLWEWMH